MCDTLCVHGAGRMLFAKNSDRPVDEVQVLEPHPRRGPGEALATQYLSIGDAGAASTIGSRPTWLWGFEHGVNEHRVAVGNERVWTVDDPRDAPPALIGMDLVRLALERAHDADGALEVITSLLDRHGQGGNCEPERDEPYFSSFLVADPHHAWVLETSARTWVARPVEHGTAISNRISLRTDWTRSSPDLSTGADFDAWRDPAAPTGVADHRLVRTRALAATRAPLPTPHDLVAVLRDHGTHPWGRPGGYGEPPAPPPVDLGDDWQGVTVCMHVRGYQATTASMVAELAEDPRTPARVWAAPGAPCVSVYLPIFPPSVPSELASPATWHRFARLRARVEDDGAALTEVRAVLDPVEADLWARADALAARPDPAALARFTTDAFAPVDAALRRLGV